MTMEGSQKSALSGDDSVSMWIGANTSLTWVSLARNGFEGTLVGNPTKDTGVNAEVQVSLSNPVTKEKERKGLSCRCTVDLSLNAKVLSNESWASFCGGKLARATESCQSSVGTHGRTAEMEPGHYAGLA